MINLCGLQKALTAPQVKASHSHVLQCKGWAWISLLVQKDFIVGHLYRRPCHKAELSTETGLLLDVHELHSV